MKCRALCLGCLLVLAGAPPVVAGEPADWAAEHLEELVTLYRHFHQTPELSFHERETAARLAATGVTAMAAAALELLGGGEP